jgi:hypothetical protein
MWGCQRCRSVPVPYGPQALGGAGYRNGHSRLLHIDEEVALEDVLPFLVLLGLFVRFVLPTRERGVREQNTTGVEWNGGQKAKSTLTYFQPSMVLHLQQ